MTIDDKLEPLYGPIKKPVPACGIYAPHKQGEYCCDVRDCEYKTPCDIRQGYCSYIVPGRSP